MSFVKKAAALTVDFIFSALILMWLIGGVTYHGRLILSHGGDLRRVAIGLALLAAFFPSLRQSSIVLRGARGLARALGDPKVRWFSLGFVGVLALGASVLQALALRYPIYDVGLYHQVIWSISHGHGFVSTISGAGDFLRDHLSLSFFLLVPFFRLMGSSPLALPIIQVFLIGIGISAWVWLASRKSKTLAAATFVFAVCMQSLWGNMRWGFHESGIALAAYSWAFALLCEGSFWENPRGARLGLISMLWVIAAMTKEIHLLNVSVAFFGLSVICIRAKRRIATFSFLLLACALIAAFVGYELIPHPADKNYFDRYYSYLGHGLKEALLGILLHPMRVIDTVGVGELARYFKTVFLPWLFLPFFALAMPRFFPSRRVLWILLVILPSLASAALSTDRSLRGQDFHYAFELWPALAVCTIVLLGDLGKTQVFWAWALLSVFSLNSDPWSAIREYAPGAVAEAPMRAKLREIPEADSVLADEMLGTWVSSRLRVARWENFANLGAGCPDWFVMRVEEKPSLQELLARCDPHASLGQPAWRVGEWAAYRTNALRSTR